MAPAVSERRLTSVLFGDLVGFTPLAEARDAEDVRALLSDYFTAARTVIERYGGTVEKFIGDAVMAVWGVPVAHEDDAERSVRAGLDLVAAITALGEDTRIPGLSMRVGVVTGEVAVTLGAVGEGMVAGDAVNTAARVQAAAAPGEVWVDEATRALTSAAVTYDDAGVHALKGKAAAVPLFRAARVIAAVGGAQRVDGLEAPFTGRDRDLRLVKELLHATAEDGRPRLVSVTGAPGVGKSRLGWEFEKYVDGISMVVRWHRGRCLSYGEGVAFWALAEMVRARIGAIESDPTTVVERKLDDHLADLVADTTERGWLRPRLAALLATAGTAATFARQELFAAWALFLERQSGDARRVVVLVVEDVHHADSGLLDFLDYLLDRAHFPLFVLTLGRPEVLENRPQWGSGRRATAIYLEPLPEAAMADLVAGLVDGLPADARDLLVRRAEGVPLYAVETVRALIDRDVVVPRGGRYVLADDAASRIDLSALDAPATLQALISSRLDTLTTEERQAVQNASVLGLAFSADGLAVLCGRPDVSDVLDALVRKEIVAPDTDRWSAERGQYRFVQALVRSVAYETLSKRDRKARHLAVIEVLERSADVEELPGVLAAHYLSARDAAPADPDATELAQRAAALLEQAATRAAGLGSPDEALRHYEAAIALTADDARIAALALAGCKSAVEAGDNAAAARLAARAREAATAADDDVTAGLAVAYGGRVNCGLGNFRQVISDLTPVYEALADREDARATVMRLALVLSLAHGFTGDLATAHQYGDRGFALAEWDAEPRALMEAAATQGSVLSSSGRPFAAVAFLQAAVDLARAQRVPGLGTGPYNNLLSLLRFRDLPQALDLAAEGVADARLAGDRGILSYLVVNQATALYYAGRWDDVIELAERYEDWGRIDIPAERLLDLTVLLVDTARGGDGQAFTAGALPPRSEEDALLRATELLGASLLAEVQGDLDARCRWALEAEELQYGVTKIDDDYPMVWLPAIAAAVAAQDFVAARRILSHVTDAPPGSVPGYLKAQLPRARALIDAGEGADGSIDDDFRAAVDALRAFGCPFEVACTQLEHAEWLAGQGRQVEAQLLLDEAQMGFAAVRASRWLERVAARRTPVAR